MSKRICSSFSAEHCVLLFGVEFAHKLPGEWAGALLHGQPVWWKPKSQQAPYAQHFVESRSTKSQNLLDSKLIWGGANFLTSSSLSNACLSYLLQALPPMNYAEMQLFAVFFVGWADQAQKSFCNPTRSYSTSWLWGHYTILPFQSLPNPSRSWKSTTHWGLLICNISASVSIASLL